MAEETNEFIALVARAKQMNAKARDLDPVPRGLMFTLAAYLAIGEDTAFEQLKGEVNILSVIIPERKVFIELATKYKLVESVIREKLVDTGVALCSVLEKEITK